MSDQKPRRTSKRTLRLLAWAAGVASFAGPGVAIGLAPKPRAAEPKPEVIVLHQTIKRIVYTPAPVAAQKARVRYVTAPAQAQPVTTTKKS